MTDFTAATVKLAHDLEALDALFACKDNHELPHDKRLLAAEQFDIVATRFTRRIVQIGKMGNDAIKHEMTAAKALVAENQRIRAERLKRMRANKEARDLIRQGMPAVLDIMFN